MQPKIIFVCTGNICRSPMAEAIFTQLSKNAGYECEVSSAGFQPKLESVPYHPLATEVCSQSGIELFGSSKLFTSNDLALATYVFVLDESNLHSIFLLDSKEEHFEKIYFLREFTSFPSINYSVPDPFGKDKKEFEISYKMIEDCCRNILQQITTGLPPSKAIFLAERSPIEIKTTDFWVALFRENSNSWKDRNCLLLGCKEDLPAFTLAKSIVSVMAIDSIQRENILQSRNLEYRTLRVNKISTIEKQFDLILCMDFLDYVFPERMGEFLEVLNKLLAENGIFVMNTIGSENCQNWKKILLNYFPNVITPGISNLSFLNPFAKKKTNDNQFVVACHSKQSLKQFIDNFEYESLELESNA